MSAPLEANKSGWKIPLNPPRAAEAVRPRERFFNFWTRLLPPMDLPFKVAIFSDFDGTISQTDSLKYILNQRADRRWHDIENAMAAGTLAEREGLKECFRYYSENFDTALNDVMEHVQVDPYFSRFNSWAEYQGYDLTVLSGGFESLIRPLFKRAGLPNVKVLANDAEVVEKKWAIKSCGVKPLCDLCNHCKSASLLETIRRDPKTCVIYIGDGHTDSCPVQLADIVFAKGYLANFCRETGIEHYEFEDFRDVHRQLKWKLRLLRRYIENRPPLFSLQPMTWPAQRFIERARAA